MHLLPQPRLVCIGHSHIRAVMAAARSQGVELTGIDFWTTGEPVVEEGVAGIRADVAEQLTGKIFSMVGGVEFNIMGLCVHPRRFDFVLPSEPHLPFDPEAELVPAGAVKGALAEMGRKYFGIMGLIREASRGRVHHIEAPPPFDDDGRMLAEVYWPHFDDKLREVSPAALRYKLWRLHSEIVREFCAERDIVFVPHPKQAVGADGFLLPRYYADPMHVNEEYGALVLAQMRQAP